jgi:hypothetical protein
MRAQFLRLGSIAAAFAVVSLVAACAAMQVPNNPTTQAFGEASAVTGAMASTVALAAPVPWGQVVASALGAISVIAGIIAHSTVSKNSAQEVTSAVATGIQAASQTLGIGAGSAAPSNAANALPVK